MAASGGSATVGAKSSDRVSTELVALTYGAFVASVVRDAEDIDAANKELHGVGKSLGARLADDYLSRGDPEAAVCRSFRDSIRTIAESAFPTYLGIKASIVFDGGGVATSGAGAVASGQKAPKARCQLCLSSNPLADFVELPAGMESLEYNQSLCGAVEGALEQVGYVVQSSLSSDIVRGDAQTVIEVQLKEELKDAAGDEYKDE